MALLLVGFGHVGRRFARLLAESRAALEALGIDARVVGVTTGGHGGLFDACGIDAIAAAEARDRGLRLDPAGPTRTSLEAIAALTEADADAHVVIETTPLEVREARVAIAHVRAAIAAGAHVVSANKGPVAVAYRGLTEAAASAGVSFLFEGAVMDGIPIFNLVRETLPACEVRGFRGVVNSTTNYILTAMEQGESFASALARMQEAGVAEADASLDVDGWDAAAKAAALANVWFDARITPADVAREGIGPDTAARVAAARRDGRRLKLVARGTTGDGRSRVAVALEALEADDPLAQLDGQANALEIDTWPAGRIVITQRDGGLEKTAYALVADLVTVARRIQARGGDGRPGRGARA